MSEEVTEISQEINVTSLLVAILKTIHSIEVPSDMVLNFTPYKTKAGKTMAHIVFTNKDKELTRAIVFSTMYKIALAKLREGMACDVVLSKLDDGTLMVKEIK